MVFGAPVAAPASAVEEGIFPRSFQIPGTNVSFAIGGYAKVDFIQDFDAVGNPYYFKVNSIPVDGTPAADQSGRTTIHARETRINLDFRSADADQTKFRAFFEGDFFSDDGDFRTRHAYGEFGRLLGGQTWTTFMDISARPPAIDYVGTDSQLFVRQPMLRYTTPVGDRWTWAIAVENPVPQIDVVPALSGSARSTMPDIPTRLRFEKDRAHVQFAAIVRQIRFDGEQGDPDLSEIGWGLSATFKVKTIKKDELMGQLAYGEGVGRYVESVTGLNEDAVLTPANTLELLPMTAVVLGYLHHWRDTVRSTFAVGMSQVDTHPSQPLATTEKTADARLNVIWTPFAMVDYGGEIMWGRHETRDGSEGDAWRLQVAAAYRFN
jgi:hypothetical protein